MLGKLMRYELRSTGRILSIFYIVAVATVLLQVLASLPEQPVLDILLTLGTIVIIPALLVGTLVIIAVRYYQNLFGREGYLTQTLPVSKGKVLLSHTLLALFWLFCSALICLLAIVALVFILSSASVDLPETTEPVQGGISDLLYLLYQMGALVLQAVSYIAVIFFCITLSNTRLFIKNGVLFSIVWYIAAYTVLGLINTLLTTFLPVYICFYDNAPFIALQHIDWGGYFSNLLSEPPYLSASIWGPVVNCCCIAVLFPLINWMLKKKTSVR